MDTSRVLWVITALTIWRSLKHMLGHDGGAQSIASIPLDTVVLSHEHSFTLVTYFTTLLYFITHAYG